jgi:hypothetical protein
MDFQKIVMPAHADLSESAYQNIYALRMRVLNLTVNESVCVFNIFPYGGTTLKISEKASGSVTVEAESCD